MQKWAAIPCLLAKLTDATRSRSQREGARIGRPSRRFQSAWMGISVHSIQSVFLIIIVLTLVLG